MRLPPALVCAAIVTWSSAAAADGWLAMRGAYYKEKSTLVVQPMLDGEIGVTPDDDVQFHFLVDSITSASPAAGSPVEFTERRYEAGMGWLRRFGRFSLGLTGRLSDESDYTSWYGSVRGQLELNDKNTTVALTLGRGYDEITNGVAAAAAGALRIEHLHVGLTSLSLTQLLSPQLLLSVVWDVSDLHGYQANMYRGVFGGAAPEAERVPDFRLRSATYLGVRGYLPETRTTGIAGYRFYVDDWGIVAHTAEARLVQELVPGLEVRARYRIYTQGAADFFKEIYSAEEVADQSVYITEDEKLSSFSSHTVGGQLVLALSLFGAGGSLGNTMIDLTVDRVFVDNAFGNAWLVQAGLVVPFER